MTFLSEEDVTVMEWLAHRPHMNPIQNVWKLLNERAKEKESKERQRTMEKFKKKNGRKYPWMNARY